MACLNNRAEGRRSYRGGIVGSLPAQACAPSAATHPEPAV